METRPETAIRLVSLRRRFIWLLAGVVCLFLAGMSLSLVFSLRSNDIAEQRLLELEARQTQALVTQRWNFYREMADNLARDTELINLMLLGLEAESQEWALSRQRLLPSILGLALVSAQGDVYGDASLLRVGPSCQRDLYQLESHRRSRVLVHRDGPGLEHGDVVAEVLDPGGEVLGRVFVSVRLLELQHLIDSITESGHTITLQDSAGRVVVRSGDRQPGMRTISLPLATMGWTLVVQSSDHSFSEGGGHLLAGMLTLISVVVLLIVVVLRFRRPIMQDINAALDALACLTRNENESAPPIKTRYAELSVATEDINRIAQQLHDQRKQLARLSLTDVLTGLPNRRAFESQFPHMLGLAERGQSTSLVSIDLDHFKSINDRLGHAAGDKALIALANAFKALTRSADMAYRLAGDEFVVIMCGLDNNGVLAWYQRLSDRFRSELRATGFALDNTISAGQTWLRNEPGDSIDQALARADHALYQAKARGRGRIVLDDGVREDAAE